MERRRFLKTLVAGTAFGAMGGYAADGTKIKGTVSGDGRPLVGVVVSDGLNCVCTDKAGRFTLPRRDKAHFIFVSSPAGWRAEGGVFYRPADAADFSFRLVPWRTAKKRGVKILHVADSEVRGLWPLVTGPYLDTLHALAKSTDADFILHTGDIIGAKGCRFHKEVLNGETAGRPVVYCVGNHDLVKEGPYGEYAFEQCFGPCWYSFDVGGVHFVVTPMEHGDCPPSYTHNDVADWLRNDLAFVAKKTPVVFFNHYVPKSRFPNEYGRVFGNGASRLELEKACNFAGFVYGHTHHSFFNRMGKVTMVATANPTMGGISHDAAVIREIDISAEGAFKSKSHYMPAGTWKQSSAGAAWETDLGAPVYFGAPVAAGERVYLATLDDDGLGTSAVFAIDAATGKIAWKSPMPASVKNTIVLHAGKVVAQDVQGHVRAFDAATGAPAWRYDITGMTAWPIENGLAVDATSGILVAGGGKWQVGLDASTGRAIWTKNGWYHQGEAILGTSAAANGVVVSPSQWKGIHANDLATGKELWFAKDGDTFFCGATPRIDGDRVQVLCNKSFIEFDLRTGKIVRTKDVGVKLEVSTSILAAGGKYIFGSWDGLIALDATTLETVWRIAVGAALVLNAPYSKPRTKTVPTSPVALDATRGAFAAPDGKIRIFNLSDGKIVSTFDTGAPYFAGPAVAAGRVVAVDFAGRVRAWNL